LAAKVRQNIGTCILIDVKATANSLKNDVLMEKTEF